MAKPEHHPFVIVVNLTYITILPYTVQYNTVVVLLGARFVWHERNETPKRDGGCCYTLGGVRTPLVSVTVRSLNGNMHAGGVMGNVVTQ